MERTEKEEIRGSRSDGRAPRVAVEEHKATPAVLTFLRETRAGRMVNLTSLEEEEGDMQEIVLRSQREEGGWEGLTEREGPP